MAKFLPFVVEKSTPLYIYNTLVSRGKGINAVTLLSVFKIVLNEGITKVRDYASSLPELPLEKVYEELLKHYSTYIIHPDGYEILKAIAPFIKKNELDKLSSDLSEYDIIDAIGFLYVLSLNNEHREYCDLPFEVLSSEEKMSHIENHLNTYKLFSSEGKEYYFKDEKHLLGYIIYNAVMASNKPLPVKAVFKNSGDNNASS